MQIVLIFGIGPTATDFYYRSLIERFAFEEKMDTTTVHADTLTLIKNLMEDNKDREVAIYNDLKLRQKKQEPTFSLLLLSLVVSVLKCSKKNSCFQW